LVKRLESKKRALHNLRRRAKCLSGKVSDLMNELNNQRLLTTQAEDMLKAYEG